MNAPIRGVPCDAPGYLHPVGRASLADAPQIADLLADAFAGYPWTDWMVLEGPRRERLRDLLLLDLTQVALPHGSVWAARCPSTAGVVGAVAVLRPDRPVPADVWTRVAEQQAELLGDRSVAVATAERALDDVRPTGPVLVVATMGVAPDHRRRGLAVRMLAPALELADRLAVPAYLETSTRSNEALYGRVGFAVAAHRRVAGAGPHVWVMTRPPRASSGERQVRELGP